MSRPVTAVKTPDYTQYSEIIDVRSPAEFAEDHVPGAINLWVLDNEQRAVVGTLYKQVGSFEAKKTGSVMMARNIAHWLETHFQGKDKNYHPLVYCWRGGQRSEGMAGILSRISWNTHMIHGGYKHYRQGVIEQLDSQASALHLRIISGLTGTGKTRLLNRLNELGEQTIDLEGLANHRGSLLGKAPHCAQPSQKYFESLLAREINLLDPQRVTWVEAESNKVGNLHCPKGLWQNMRSTGVVHIEVSIENRVNYLLQDYPHFVEDPDPVKTKLQILRHTRGAESVSRWESQIDARDGKAFVKDILVNHYDIGYAKSIEKNRQEPLMRLEMNPLDDASIDAVARQLIQHG